MWYPGPSKKISVTPRERRDYKSKKNTVIIGMYPCFTSEIGEFPDFRDGPLEVNIVSWGTERIKS